MKTNYKVNHTNGTIIITKDFSDRAGIVNSEEYKILRQLKKDFPNYTLSQKTVKVSTKRDYHKELTIERMARFILKFDENSLIKFQEVKEYYKPTKGYSANVRAWFLAKYPDYKEQEKLFETAYDNMIRFLEEAETTENVKQETKPAAESVEKEGEAD